VWKGGKKVRERNGARLIPLAVRILVRLIDKRKGVVYAHDLKDLLTQGSNDDAKHRAYISYISLLRRCLNSDDFDFDEYVSSFSKSSDQERHGGYEFIGEVRLSNERSPSRKVARRQDDSIPSSPDDFKLDITFTPKELDLAMKAWSKVDFPRLYTVLATYYEHKRVPLFSYRCSTVRVPLYVRPSWSALTKRSLPMDLDPVEQQVALSESRRRFLALHTEVRRILRRKALWNGPVFRLVNLRSSERELNLRFEHGHFFNSLAHQDFLEHETRLAVCSMSADEELEPGSLNVRESVASSTDAVEHFCENQVCGIGVSNLILFRVDRRTYRPAVRARGKLSLAATSGIFDNISSGIFDIANADTAIDLDIKYKVFKEIYEELFGNKEVEGEIRHLEPDFFFKEPGVKELAQMLKDGRAFFEVTGFCFDLVRVAPEITTVLVIRDPSYYKNFQSKFVINEEYEMGFKLEIPRALGDVDEYLAKRFPSNPARPHAGLGFDPSKWTLPGAFCFYQGLQRASKEGVL